MKKAITLLLMSVLAVFMVLAVTSCTSEDAAGAGIFGATMCIIVVSWLVGIFFFVIWIIMLIDLVKREDSEFPSGENEKIKWLLIVILLGGIGAIIYYFMIKKKLPRKK